MRHRWCIFLVLVSAAFAAAQNSKPITREEVTPWLNQKFDCGDEAPVYFWRFDYFDFTHGVTPEAIVVASTCETGTAGPDVHSVVSRDASGNLVELKIAEVERKTYDNRFGNRNYDMTVEGGLLIATFTDDIERETPLIIKYKWNGDEFAVASIKKTGIYETSYDCHGTLTEIENAICHVEEIADLDLELSSVYKSVLGKLPAPERAALRSEQRDWLADRSKHCVIYKSWVGCLTDYYQKRIDDLKKRSASLP